MSKTDHAGSYFICFILAVFLVFSLNFVLIGASRAGQQGQEKLVLNLEQLIRMAVAKSPELGESRSELEAARSDLEQARAAYYPQIESRALIGPVADAKLPEIRNNTLSDPSPSTSLSTTGIFGRLDVTVTQPLYTFGKLSNRKDAASRGLKAVEFQAGKKENEIALRVSRLYYALVLARGGMKAAREADNFFEDAKGLVTRLLELDSPNVSEADLYRIDAYRAGSRRSQAEAEKGSRVAYFALRSMIKLPPETEFEVTDESLVLKGEELADLETYIQNALSKRPEVKQLNEALEAQKFQVEAARSDRYPSIFLALQGSHADAPNRDTLDNAYIPDDFNHTYAGVVAGLKWDFDFGILSARVDKGRAEYRKLLFSKENAEMNIPIQVATSYQEVEEWKASVRTFEEASLASRKWVVAALANFNMGVGIASDMLNAIEKYGDNKGRYVEALFNYNVALSELKYAAGGVKEYRERDGTE